MEFGKLLGRGMCYVIGIEKKTNVNEIYRALVDVGGFEAPVECMPRLQGDVRDAIDSSLVERRHATYASFLALWLV